MRIFNYFTFSLFHICSKFPSPTHSDLWYHCFGWPSDGFSQYAVALVDQATVFSNGFIPVDQVTTLLNKDLHHRPLFSTVTSIWLPFIFGFKSLSVICQLTDWLCHAWAISSSYSTCFGWPTWPGLFFCTLSREFGRGLLPRWGFLIIIVSYLF